MLKKITISIFIIITAIFTFSINTFAEETDTNYQIIIDDEAELLTESEEGRLYETMKKIAVRGNVVFKSTRYNPKNSTAEYAEELYLETFGYEEGTMFLIDMYNRYIYIYTEGSLSKTITNGQAEIITDNVYKYASDENYYECANQAFKQINALINGEKIASPMKYISNAILAVMLATLCNYALFKHLSTIKASSNKEILTGTKGYVKSTDPIGKQCGTHRVYSPQSSGSSSGGSSGGFSGGGGGHSSSGGGHRF